MKLSVMMLAYNHERVIGQALESVLAQRVKFDYEIVVGEDCSTDGTRAILMDFYRRYPDRIVPLIQNRNVGMMRNVQATLASCRGQYLAILEGDDYWTCENKLQRQVEYLDGHPDCAICMHRAQICDEAGVGLEGALPRPNYKAGSYSIKDIIADNFIHTSTVLCRKSSEVLVPDVFLDFTLYDWPLFILLARSGKIDLIDELMSVYRMHSGGSWTSGSEADQIPSIIHMMKQVDDYLNFEYTRAIARTMAVLSFDMASIQRLKGNRMATTKYLAASLRDGGLPLAGRWRGLAALIAYSIFGFRPAKHAAGANGSSVAKSFGG